MFICCIL